MAAMQNVLLGMSLAGNTANTFNQSQGIKAQSQYQRQVLESNARIAELQSEDAIVRGNKEANNYRKSIKKLIGSQRASFAAQGIDVESGSALEIQQDTAALGELDALTIQNNAWRESWGYKVEAVNNRSQSGFAKIAAKNKVANTILTGGLSFVRDYQYSTGKLKSRRE